MNYSGQPSFGAAISGMPAHHLAVRCNKLSFKERTVHFHLVAISKYAGRKKMHRLAMLFWGFANKKDGIVPLFSSHDHRILNTCPDFSIA